MEFLEKTIDRLRAFEPDEGYYGAFSGGKDSQAMYECAKMANVKVDWHFHKTSVDPPQLLKFIRQNYPDVEWRQPTLTMFQLILKNKMLPTRRARFCCRYLKEGGGEGRVVLVGVRAQESSTRSKYSMVEACRNSHQTLVRPILDWSLNQVWGLLSNNNIQHCELYDSPYSFKRIGCIGCPMAGKGVWKQFRLFPKHKHAYLNTIKKLMDMGRYSDFNSADAVLRYWINGVKKDVFLKQDKQERFCFD